MNKSKTLIAMGFMVIAVIVVYWAFNVKMNYEIIDIQDSQNEVLAEMKAINQYVQDTNEWMNEQLGGEENNDVAFSHAPAKTQDNEDPKVKLIKYFITGLTIKNTDLFISCFNPETISKDLFTFDNPDKNEVALDLIKQMTREGKIKEIHYKENRGFLNESTNEITLTFIYEDGQEAKVNFTVESFNDIHDEQDEEHSVYVISTSALTMIEQIETALS